MSSVFVWHSVLIDEDPAGAARRIGGTARTARRVQGRACLWRGGANPCSRALFWHPVSRRRAVPVGSKEILLVGSERSRRCW
jgi:hypothetical protein